MTRVNHLSNGKSVMILGTVVGCLIILWPKVFYPMMQGGFQATNQDMNLKSKIHPRMMSSKVPPKGFDGQSNFQGSESNIPLVDHSSIGGASVGLIMTIYTIGIIFLFFYTIFKYVRSDDSLDYIDEGDTFNGGNGQDYYDKDLQENKMKGETFDKFDHQQGDCLKKLAINYVRCKTKLSEDDDSPALANDDDGVSMAYRTLLGDMLQLRDYLYELQCSINGCDEPCDEFCNCSDGIIDNLDDVYESDPHDFGFDVGEAINQMFNQDDDEDTDNEQEKTSNQGENGGETNNKSVNPVPDYLIDSKVEDGQLIKTRGVPKRNN